MKLQDLTPQQYTIREQDGSYVIHPTGHPEEARPLFRAIADIFARSEFVGTARELRRAQKAFYAATDAAQKKIWLREAKNKEYKFDTLLEKVNENS